MSNAVKILCCLAIGLGLGLGAAMGSSRFFFDSRESEKKEAAPQAVREERGSDGRAALELENVQRQVKALAASQSNLASRMSSLSRPDDEETDEPLQLSDDDLPMEQESQRAEKQAEMQTKVLEDTFLREDRDPKWSDMAERNLGEAMREASMANVELVNTQCRRTLCRMQFVFADSQAVESSIRTLTNLVPWKNKGYVEGGFDPRLGKTTATFYVAREGNDIPSFESANI